MVGAVPSIVGFVLAYFFLDEPWLQITSALSLLRSCVMCSVQESPAYLDENGYRQEALAALQSLKHPGCSFV